MAVKEEIKTILKKLTGNKYVEVVVRGNSAITSALSIVQGNVLIPEEGGWLHYKTAPKSLGLDVKEVKCNQAKIDLVDLEKHLTAKKFGALLYQNPGGYFAEQPMRKMYSLCKKYCCLVILDVSGGIGTRNCDGNYADIIVGSFGKWKLVEARVGGFIGCNDHNLWKMMADNFAVLDDNKKLAVILEKLKCLPNRIKFLSGKRKKIISDLSGFNLVCGGDLGFVVVVKFVTLQEKESIINYCRNNRLEYTECPRYIRLNEKAISIEVKRL